MSNTPPDPDLQQPTEPGGEHGPAPRPGNLIDGKYRLGRLVGEGGMGAVYEAQHVALGTKVAIKILNEGFTADDRAVARFRREARATAAIRHPNIVTVHDTATTEEGVPFLVMELLTGESLSSLLRRERKLSPTVSTAIACQLLAGLSAAHASKVIHRDLKPGNVLVATEPDGARIVKILDFGISKFFSDPVVADNTASGAVVGTPRFMAPEQARGQSDLDARLDLYAVGVLLYRMATGRLPATGSSQEEIITKVLEGNHVPPRELEPRVPAELERVILKSLAVDRDERYQTAAEFIEALQDAMPGMVADAPIHVPVSPQLADEEASGRSGTYTIPPLVAAGTKVTRRRTLPHPRAKLVRTALIAAILLVVAAVIVAVSLHVRRGEGPGVTEPRSLSGVVGTQYDGTPFRFGMTRYLPRDMLLEQVRPLLRHLASELKRPVKLYVHYDYVDLSTRLKAGDLDLADLPAYAYVRAKAQTHIELLFTHVSSTGPTYEGLVLAKADSDIQVLADLKGKVFCYVHPGSSSGYLYPRALLRREGLDPDQTFSATRFAAGHLASLRALHSGACDGAAVFAGMLFGEAHNHGLSPTAFRILARTDRIPHDAYCVPKGQDPRLTRQLREAFLALHPGSKLAQQVLGKHGRLRGFVETPDSAYDPVRRVVRYMDKPVPQH